MIGSTAFLIDTNILIYAFDPRDSVKQPRAIKLLDRLMEREQAVLSVQCLSEFFNVSTRKLPEPLAVRDAIIEVERFGRACRILDLTAVAILEGCRGTGAHQLSIWDALIWSVAKLNQVPYVLSEDFPHGLFLEGVRFQNPFVPEFDEALLEP